jgi:NAD(P)-dependent dehydrogenase (short-subunit alcohol dehydrogenase family)
MNLGGNQETIFVSGGTSGLGLEISEHFVKLGKSVIFCARSEESVDAATNHLKSLSINDQLIIGFSNDVSNRTSTTTLFNQLKKLEIFVDILICNAGVIGPINKFLENELQEWQEAFDINLYGVMNLIKEVLPSMISNKKGRIIHISGGGATAPLFGMTSYAASKAAAVRFIETLALEYRDSGVTFNSVAPGMLKTKLLDQMLDAGKDRIGENLFIKSSAKAEAPMDSRLKALNLIDFLASEASNGITGKLISAEWDNWMKWQNHLSQLENSDLFTLRRITGRDRGQEWGDL